MIREDRELLAELAGGVVIDGEVAPQESAALPRYIVGLDPAP